MRLGRCSFGFELKRFGIILNLLPGDSLNEKEKASCLRLMNLGKPGTLSVETTRRSEVLLHDLRAAPSFLQDWK